MGYNLFAEMLQAGMVCEMCDTLRALSVSAFPHLKEDAREQVVEQLQRLIGHDDMPSDEEVLAAIAKLQAMFPSPTSPPEA